MEGLGILTCVILSGSLTAISLLMRVVTKRASLVVFLVSLGASLAFGVSGLVYVAIVLVFSSAVTVYKITEKVKAGIAEGRRGARDAGKVLGATGAGGILSWLVVSGIVNRQIGEVAFVAAFGAIVSDTFASELGVLSSKRPRMILPPWNTVDAGVSGAISLLGEVASFAGNLIAVSVAFFLKFMEGEVVAFSIVASILVAEHLDSLMGASIQEAFFCPRCLEMTDKPFHLCGQRANHVRGSHLISNSRVNFIATSASALLAVVITQLLH
jgi:uncharacterized protein (TIGR00297 family)